jgi:hypothetical protein
MPVLSEANIVQAKTGSAEGQTTVSVTLDNPTQPGGTVIVEMYGPAVWPGMPAGWEFDMATVPAQLWAFRLSGGPGGETSWSWTTVGPVNWLWRATEWDTTLDPVSPLDAQPAANNVGGSGVTTLSTGTSGTSVRDETVALATHHWTYPLSAPSRVVSFGGHTNGFVERAEQRQVFSNYEMNASWSALFVSAPQTFECTATVSNSAPNAGDTYYAMVVVYAATQPVIEAGPTMADGGGGGP